MWKPYTILRFLDFELSNSIEIISKRSAMDFGHTSVTIPLKAAVRSGFLNLERNIKRGQTIEIEMGYDNVKSDLITGYIGRVNIGKTDITLDIEDKSFLLRSSLENKSFAKATLKEIVQYITNGFGFEITGDLPDINYENFKILNTTSLEAFKQLCSSTGMVHFFTSDGKLYVGFNYLYKSGEVKVDTKYIVENNLTVKNAAEKLIKIRATSFLKDNTKLNVEVGDEGGDLKTNHYRNITTESELKILAENDLKKYKYDGYEGSFKSFLLPKVDVAGTCKLYDNGLYKGDYYITETNVNVNASGAFRTISLGIKL